MVLRVIDLQGTTVTTHQNDSFLEDERVRALDWILVCAVTHHVELGHSQVTNGVFVEEDELGVSGWSLVLLSP